MKELATFTIELFNPSGSWYGQEDIVVEVPQDGDIYRLRKLLYKELNNRHPTLHAAIIDERIKNERLWWPLIRYANQ